MTKSRKCDVCKEKESIWSMQWIPGGGLTFYLDGWHIRGLKVVHLCDDCKEKIQKAIEENEDGS